MGELWVICRHLVKENPRGVEAGVFRGARPRLCAGYAADMLTMTLEQMKRTVSAGRTSRKGSRRKSRRNG
jgi:hypothetical protein